VVAFCLANPSTFHQHILSKIRLCYVLEKMFSQAITEPYFFKKCSDEKLRALGGQISGG
jgi:hypothetical protein